MNTLKKIQYPNKKTTKNPLFARERETDINASNRGMSLEGLLNQTNTYYIAQNKAVVHKKPTPIQVVNVEYKSRSTAKIIEAYYTQPSTTDYNGVYKGHYLDFEAKQTNLDSLPFQNFHQHQIEHMEHVLMQKGICFVIIYYKKIDAIYLVPARYVIDLYKQSKRDVKVRKSISAKMAKENGYEITASYFPFIDYLPAVDLLLGGSFIEK